MTVGIPNPPFLMMAPRGAPMKKNIKQANERVNFLWISIWYFLSRLVLLSVLVNVVVT